ncbi:MULTISPECIES: TRAP transporter substrate-binding protein [unclassified Oceanobacter]|uniref:TRAP transporter substrate-binding protein n=1 Tax=unclassified Oceanobacter TaxID=2620260 RepID=UPI0026E114B4|nr:MULTISPECIES: TRAP transporter substrate-binding protein [unclassified Oceanobacter]MDO6683365.1 TRAP transporter substrate-binding protein [Oceanobacter sp. 5_MG-2023]MDP2507131.1 TRAP transporter substrate-binding protein [Oceanobacter sp. 3_MG-2023]MDP2549045.1 TRAP transporter substrate-binding protein [Oceanobacter sp. 4_MG-2023]MDP2609922.1 TRAP transporter substrate-binding protein [Oceanobacter sp. 1_MG-2023]MDP2613196.1 TRAP transporter substrate-binding protein [Oceanobacter sp. 2
MKLKKLLLTLSLTVAGMATLNTQAAEPEFTFKLHHFLTPLSAAHQKMMVPWANKVMAESDGRIKIDIYPAMQLGGKPPQLFDQARKGVADIVWTVGGYTPGRFSKAGVFELPFMPASAEATSMAMQEYAETEMQDELSDVHLLAIHTHAPGALHSRDVLIKTTADMEGLKMRAPNKAMAEAFSLVGGSPVFMPVPALPSALSKGVVDVAVMPFEVVNPLKIQQLAPNHTEIKGEHGLYTQFFLFTMNKKAYAKLPADLKQVIDNNSGINEARRLGHAMDLAELPGYAASEAENNPFYTLTEEETARWKQTMQPVTDDWIEDMNDDGENGTALYKKAVSLIKKYQQVVSGS